MRNRRALLLALAAVTADYVGVTMMRVTLPFYAKALGGSATLVGGLETAYGAGQWIGSATLPGLSDTLGRRRALLLCLVCSVAGYGAALAALRAGDPVLLLLSRFPVGFAKQAVTVSRAVVADCTEASEERSCWMSLLGSALGVGCTVGPFLGSQAAEHLGEDAPVAIAVAMFVLLSAAVAGALPETMPEPAGVRGGGGGGATAEKPPLWRNREVLAALAVLGLPELGLISHTSVAVNTFAAHHLRLSKAWLAGLSSAVSAMQAAVAGVLCTFLAGRGCSDVTMMQLGIASFAATSACIWAWQSPEAIALSAPGAALANGFLRSIPAAFLSKRVPRDRQGQAMGLLDMCSAALRVVAPVLAGSLMDRFGGGSVFLGHAVLFTLSGVCLSFFDPGRGGAARVADDAHKKRS